MIEREHVAKKVLEFLEQLNEESDLSIEISENTTIIGEGTQFDSMTFLDLAGMIEDWIDSEFDTYVSIILDGEDLGPDGPFSSVGRLIDRLTELINQEIVASGA